MMIYLLNFRCLCILFFFEFFMGPFLWVFFNAVGISPLVMFLLEILWWLNHLSIFLLSLFFSLVDFFVSGQHIDLPISFTKNELISGFLSVLAPIYSAILSMQIGKAHVYLILTLFPLALGAKWKNLCIYSVFVSKSGHVPRG